MEFVTPEQKLANLRWLAKQRAKAQKMVEDEGFMTIDQMLEAADDNLKKSQKCKKCGLGFKSFYTLETHKGSQNCQKRQAELKGEVYIPKCQTMRHCPICDREVKFYNWKKHIQSKCHKEEVRKQNEPAFHCLICDKQFGGKRPKLMLKNHLQSKFHLKRAQKPKMGYIHNACCLKHSFEKLTLHGVSEKRQMVAVI